jgi:hypothetical protein
LTTLKGRETLGFVWSDHSATRPLYTPWRVLNYRCLAPARFLLNFISDGAGYRREERAYCRELRSMNVVPRLILIFLCLWLLSTVTRWAVDPSPSPSAMTPSRMYTHNTTYPGQLYEHGIDYEKKIDEEEQQYRNQRSAQEQAQARAYQQWEQERERGREPRWER